MRRARSLRFVQMALAGAVVSALLLLSACGGDSHLQQQASSGLTQLQKNIQYAKSIGVPDSELQPITQELQKLTSTGVPFSLFDDTPANTYYKNQINSFSNLSDKVQQVIAIVTGEYQGQAQQDLALFQEALTTQQKQKIGNLQYFSSRYTTDESLLAKAQYPKDYLALSKDAQNACDTLESMHTIYGQLTIFKNTLTQMQHAQVDVTAMQSQYTSDMTAFNQAQTLEDFQKLSSMINAQYQQAVVSSTQSLPYVGAAKLQEFKDQLNKLKTYGIDASPYQKLYDKDKAAMAKAKTISQYLTVSKQIDKDMDSMKPDLIRGSSWYLIKQLDKEAKAWGQAHLYHDKYDGKNYIPDSGYTEDGIVYWLNRENSWSYTTEDYQSVLNDVNEEYFLFEMFKKDYADKTPYNQVHQTDLDIMQRFPSLKHGTVLMISMAQESMHVFVNGKLTNAFLVTTGRVERPTLPGVWTTQDRKSPTEFKSDDPKGSPYWYPPTKINYAILYHWGGFFVHDSWWRADYGPGTQFPHVDSGGDVDFSYNGSHGCVNVREDQASWLYAHTDWNTQIVIY